MARDKDWIGANCSSGKSFKPLARKAMASFINEVFYVDLAIGSDAGDGDDWQRAYRTIDYAMDQTTANNNDYILVRGWKTHTATGVVATVDQSQVHVIGHAGIMNPIFPERNALYRDASGASDYPVMNITGDEVEVAGLGFNGSWSATAIATQISGASLDIDNGANKAYVHNCFFPGWNTANTLSGIGISGAHYSVIEDCAFHSVYDHIDQGIIVMTGPTQPAYFVITGCRFMAATSAETQYGINLYDGVPNTWVVEDCTFAGITDAINIGSATGVTMNAIVRNCFGTMAADHFFHHTTAGNVDATDDLITHFKIYAIQNVFGKDGQISKAD